MPDETRAPVNVAVNVMRARLTVLGFNLAIVTFQMNKLSELPHAGAVALPGLDRSIHLGADLALFLAFGLAVVAMVAFIASNAMDPVGVCNHWTIVAGDLLMYQSLAQTVAGFFAPYIAVLNLALAVEPSPALDAFRVTLLVTGGVAWFLACYVGPVVSLLRSPFGRGATCSLGVAYALLLLTLALVGSRIERSEMADGDALRASPSVFTEMLQPLRW